MKSVCRFAVPAALLLAMCALQARAQVLKQVPSDAMVVIKVNNLQATSGKVGALAKQFGIDQILVPLADPLEVQHHPDAVPCRFGQEGIRVVRAADAARKARGPACRREPLNHGHTGTRLGQVVGAARTVDARADDHDIGPGLIHEGKPPSDWG